jgi:hypothetical protein
MYFRKEIYWKYNTVTCRGCTCLIRRVSDWIIEFIDTLFTQLGTRGNYSAIADLHTLQFTVTHALRLSVFTSRILATDLSVSLYFQVTHKVFLLQSNSFLAISSQSPYTAIFRTRPISRQKLSQMVFFVPFKPLDTDDAENTASLL